MRYLTPKEILNSVASRIEDTSPELRVRLVRWLNEAAEELIGEKVNAPWEWLHQSVDLVAENDRVAKPADYGRLITAEFASGDPTGWYEDEYSIIFTPGASGTGTITYLASNSPLEDNETPTFFPSPLINCLVYGVLRRYHEYDEDVRFANAGERYDKFVRDASREDNARKAKPGMDRRGLMRGWPA